MEVTMAEFTRPLVGVGVLIIKKHCLLLGKRKGAHGEGTWSPPGGHLEFFEQPEACAIREVTEEVGIHIEGLRRGPYTNDVFLDSGKHYITLFIIADYVAGEPRPLEPDKCEGWEWFSQTELPSPLFTPLQNLLSRGEGQTLIRMLANSQ